MKGATEPLPRLLQQLKPLPSGPASPNMWLGDYEFLAAKGLEGKFAEYDQVVDHQVPTLTMTNTQHSIRKAKVQ